MSHEEHEGHEGTKARRKIKKNLRVFDIFEPSWQKFVDTTCKHLDLGDIRQTSEVLEAEEGKVKRLYQDHLATKFCSTIGSFFSASRQTTFRQYDQVVLNCNYSVTI